MYVFYLLVANSCATISKLWMMLPHVESHIKFLNKLFVTNFTLRCICFTVNFAVCGKVPCSNELLSTN